MSFLKVLQDAGIIQMLRNSLKTEKDKQEFDEILEQKVKEYNVLYEDLNNKVMQYKSDVEKLNANTNGEHPERENPDNG